MAKTTFDTLKFVTKLKTAGLSEPIAIAFSNAQNEIMVEAMDNTIASKNELLELKQYIALVEAHLNARLDQAVIQLNNKIDQLEAKFEIKLANSIAPLKTNIKLLNWMFSFVITSNVALLLKVFLG
jgi:hypothetical protein